MRRHRPQKTESQPDNCADTGRVGASSNLCRGTPGTSRSPLPGWHNSQDQTRSCGIEQAGERRFGAHTIPVHQARVLSEISYLSAHKGEHDATHQTSSLSSLKLTIRETLC
ncbi:unnamed protein product [Ranitomeya imitator]|uniref:Uncharacterized protein n=1 Tax=Ranitomeya imitator TaxID=111125 RepID=A0ABN9MFB7_9NEOB|nr:unnamed protein product [Ranitomeya imitator]